MKSPAAKKASHPAGISAKKKNLTKAVYKLSPGEVEALVQEERVRRRKQRIVEVRQQAKQHAAIVRLAVKEEYQVQLQKLVHEEEEKWKLEQEEKVRKLREAYMNSINSIGEAHIEAAVQESEEAEQRKRKQNEINRRRAAERHHSALAKLQSSQAQEREQQTQHIQARQEALDIERIRAADVAARPKPPPDPIASIPLDNNVKPVRVSHAAPYAGTYYHIPDPVVVEKVAPQSETGRDAAEAQQKVLDEVTEERARSKQERQEKARLRHKHALHKERLQQGYDDLLHDLSDLQRADAQRRSQVVAKIPRNIFVPPHKSQEEKKERQTEMDRQFEDMYLANTDYEGNLSLCLEPHPLPATPSMTESLDVTVEEGEESTLVNHQEVPPIQTKSKEDKPTEKSEMKSRPPVVLRDISNSATAGSGSTALKSLFDRIKTQRETWHKSHSVTEGVPPRDQGPQGVEVHDSASNTSTNGPTLTQYSLTSEEVTKTKDQGQSDSLTLSGGELDEDSLKQGLMERGMEESCKQPSVATDSPLSQNTISSLAGSEVKRAHTAEEPSTLLHPMELAARARQLPQESKRDVSQYLAEHRDRIERNKIEQAKIQEEIKRRSEEIELMREKLASQGRILPQESLLPRQPANDNLTDLTTSLLSQTDTDPASQYSQNPLQPKRLHAPHIQAMLSDSCHHSDSSTIPPYILTGAEIKKVEDHQQRLMSRHRDRQQALDEARADLRRRANQFVTAGSSYNRGSMEGFEKFQDVEISGSSDNGEATLHRMNLAPESADQLADAVRQLPADQLEDAVRQLPRGENFNTSFGGTRFESDFMNGMQRQLLLGNNGLADFTGSPGDEYLHTDKLLMSSLGGTNEHSLLGNPMMLGYGNYGSTSAARDFVNGYDFQPQTHDTNYASGPISGLDPSQSLYSEPISMPSDSVTNYNRQSPTSMLPPSLREDYHHEQSRLQEQLAEIERQKEEILKRNIEHQEEIEQLKQKYWAGPDTCANDVDRDNTLSPHDGSHLNIGSHVEYNYGELTSAYHNPEDYADSADLVKADNERIPIELDAGVDIDRNTNNAQSVEQYQPLSHEVDSMEPHQLSTIAEVDTPKTTSDAKSDVPAAQSYRSTSTLESLPARTDFTSGAETLGGNGLQVSNICTQLSQTKMDEENGDDICRKNDEEKEGNFTSGLHMRSSVEVMMDGGYQPLSGGIIYSPDAAVTDSTREAFTEGGTSLSAEPTRPKTWAELLREDAMRELQRQEAGVMATEVVSGGSTAGEHEGRFQSAADWGGMMTPPCGDSTANTQRLSSTPLTQGSDKQENHLSQSSGSSPKNANNNHNWGSYMSHVESASSLSQHTISMESHDDNTPLQTHCYSGFSGDRTRPPRANSTQYDTDTARNTDVRSFMAELLRKAEKKLGSNEYLLKMLRELEARGTDMTETEKRQLQQLIDREIDSYSPGITDEPDLTLTSCDLTLNHDQKDELANDRMSDTPGGRDIQDTTNTTGTMSLLSFENHEQSMAEDSPVKPCQSNDDDIDVARSKVTQWTALVPDAQSPVEPGVRGAWSVEEGSSCRVDPRHDEEDATEAGVHSIPVHHVHGDSSSDVSGQLASLSLQEAFAKRRQDFICTTEKRHQAAKQDVPKPKSAPSKPTAASKQQSKFNQNLAQWVKAKSRPSSKPKDSSLGVMVDKTSDDRKQTEMGMKERTARLYNKLEEVQKQKVETDRKALYAENRQKAKLFHEKQQAVRKKKLESKKR